jgi:hypothetical protein
MGDIMRNVFRKRMRRRQARMTDTELILPEEYRAQSPTLKPGPDVTSGVGTGKEEDPEDYPLFGCFQWRC